MKITLFAEFLLFLDVKKQIELKRGAEDGLSPLSNVLEELCNDFSGLSVRVCIYLYVCDNLAKACALLVLNS